MTAKTTAELQRAFRARKKAQGLHPVGGIYAPRELHAAIRAAAREVLLKAQAQAKAQPGE